jgi:hypothetical protein
MSNRSQRRASTHSRLAEALALLNQRDEQVAAANAVLTAPPTTQFAGDTHIEPPHRYWDRLPFDPRRLDQIPAPLTPPSANPPLLPPSLPSSPTEGGPPPEEGESDQLYPWEKPTLPQWVHLNRTKLPAPISEFEQAGRLNSLITDALLRKAR